MLMKACPRCKKLIPMGQSYCKDCAPIAAAQAAEAMKRKADYRRTKYNRSYNKRRDPKYLSFYRSRDWKLMSRAKLQACGYKCEAGLPGCQHLATEVHHKDPIQTPEGWEKRLDWENLEGVCTSCHNGRHPGKFKREDTDNVIDVREVEKKLQCADAE